MSQKILLSAQLVGAGGILFFERGVKRLDAAKAAVHGDIAYFGARCVEQVHGVFQAHVGQVFQKRDADFFFEKMRKIICAHVRDIVRQLRQTDFFGVVLMHIVDNPFYPFFGKLISRGKPARIRLCRHGNVPHQQGGEIVEQPLDRQLIAGRGLAVFFNHEGD